MTELAGCRKPEPSNPVPYTLALPLRKVDFDGLQPWPAAQSAAGLRGLGSSYRISIPMMRAWSWVPLVKAITIWPLLLAVAVNVFTTAVYRTPAVA